MSASQSLTFIFLGLILFFGINQARAQGCVAIRHFSSCLGNTLENNLLGQAVEQTGEIIDESIHGDAAFADYLINVGVFIPVCKQQGKSKTRTHRGI